jgi:hypothetical protein
MDRYTQQGGIDYVLIDVQVPIIERRVTMFVPLEHYTQGKVDTKKVFKTFFSFF